MICARCSSRLRHFSRSVWCMVSASGLEAGEGTLPCHRALSPIRDFIPFRYPHTVAGSFGTGCHMPFDNPNQAPFSDLELLREARSRISGRDRWVQGRSQDGDRRCLVAALSVVSGSRSFTMPNRVERGLARVLATQLPPTARSWTRLRCIPARQRLMWFNDDPRTRHEDVMALFDRTIHHLGRQLPICIPA